MSTLGLWIVTGLNSALIALVGGFTYFGLGGITRIVTKTGTELTKEVADVTTTLPNIIKEVIEEEGNKVAGAATSAATSQVSNLEGAATNTGVEMTKINNTLPEATATLATTPVTTATLTTTPVTTTALATKLRGGGKQTKENKPKRIRKPRTKKNIKKVGNQMYMNFSL
jgi:hypothetical protein